MQFYALVEERPGGSIAFFRELPGCFSAATTTEAAIQALPATIEKYLLWLNENGVTLLEEEHSGPGRASVKEHLQCGPELVGPLFEADRPAPNDREIDNALNVAATTRALIIELMTNLPVNLHNQVVTPGDWSLTQHLHHIMETENWYISRLEERPNLPAVVFVPDTEAIIMKMFEDAMDHEIVLHDLTPEQLTHVFLHEGEAWTSAKLLRRLTGHLREHYLTMMEIAGQLSTKQ